MVLNITLKEKSIILSALEEVADQWYEDEELRDHAHEAIRIYNLIAQL